MGKQPDMFKDRTDGTTVIDDANSEFAAVAEALDLPSNDNELVKEKESFKITVFSKILRFRQLVLRDWCHWDTLGNRFGEEISNTTAIIDLAPL